ncbi:MAG: DUF4276 family protein [Acidobacteriia bacterium]|nr:DUF4276 family protein [Terriglobia bacterium]
MKIGIIAEDDSDVAVLREISLKLLLPHTNVGFRHCVGRGGGAIRKKCCAYAVNLVDRGCPYIIAMHDLDQHDENELRALLQEALNTSAAKVTVVLLPRHEIESWLLYDAQAIADAFKQKELVPLPANPETVQDPKEHLGDLIWKQYRKQYLHTAHNQQIAKRIRVEALNRAGSFGPHPPFIDRVKADLEADKPKSRGRR